MLKFKIKNAKLALLAVLFITFFTTLGFWQLNRAAEKRLLLNTFAKRILHAPLSANELNSTTDQRFYRVQLTGTFDNQHTLLLDNKTFHGKIGYEIYTPFHANGLPTAILVDRGFIPIGANRQTLPPIRTIAGKTTITGILNLPPRYVALGQLADTNTSTWPLRVEYINLIEIAKLLNTSVFPYTLTLEPEDPKAYATEWQTTTMGPERHTGYAVQWFALALTLLVLLLALNRVK